jgi:hypothetical protein
MKKTIVVIILVVVIGTMLSAAGPRQITPLFGTLRWQRVNVCGVSDYVSLPVMDNVFLTGTFAPTQGLFQGCSIQASGSPYTLEGCKFFAVEKYTITCDNASSGGHR